MGLYLNPGNTKFKKTIQSEIYIDKTGMLGYTNSVLGTEQCQLCVSRPRRFGKSITAAMLAAYYGKECDSKEIFESYEISQEKSFEEHLNKYDVIYIDMNDFRHRMDWDTGEIISASDSVRLLHTEVVNELKEKYPEAVKHEKNLPTVLARINNMYGNQFVIIIDEWDTIFREDKQDTKAQKLYITLLRGLFKDGHSKDFLALAYITGILPIKKYGTESALNGFDEFTMLLSAPLGKYIGFTEKEVKSLYHSYGMDFDEAKRWYDGYEVENGLHIYNPKSVVDSVYRKEIANYWTKTETYESLKDYISMNFDGLKDVIIELLSGEQVKVDTETFENDMVSVARKDDVLTVLVHLGYLAYHKESKQVYIPNEEVRAAFISAIKKSKWKYTINAIESSEELLKATWEKNEKVVAEKVDEVHMNNTSLLKYNDENTLSCVIALAYYHAVNEYVLVREFPTGKGYADIVFLPRRYSDKPAMIIELKYDQSAEGAIAQIKEKRYIEALKEYKGNLLLVGINYDKVTKQHTCKIKEVEMD